MRRYRRCVQHGKRCYATEEAAEADLHRFALLPRTEVVPVRAYRDPGCGGWWHLTSKEDKKHGGNG